jgi:16S rRNA (guanine(966)-N(2))-methyltransferase RsmD
MANPRIIGGKARGMRLQPVPGDSTRPITDRVKEALFNILGNDIQGASLLDLFGGTGSVGIEALSRGARFVRFLDKLPIAAKTIRNNLLHTGFDQNAHVSTMDAFILLKKPADQKFEYIYIAPPQYKEMWERAMLLLDSNISWLTDDGWVIVQINPLEYKELPLTNLHKFDQRKYGDTLLIFYEIITTNDD